MDAETVNILGNQVVQIIGITATLITAITGLIVSIRHTNRIETKVDDVHSRLTEANVPETPEQTP